jgi:TRAP-type C4-dicarboxylate transport system substrate-binding protein
VGALVFQWHTRLKYITDLPIAYVYAAMLIDIKAFSKLSEQDQAIAREVMEGIYRKFDQNGVIDNDDALKALLENGLQMVAPDSAGVNQWRDLVSESNFRLGQEGAFDPALLEQMKNLIREFQGSQAAGQP